MDDAMVVAEHEHALSRRLAVRLITAVVSVSAAMAMIMTLFERAAEAQNPLSQIVCPILINLANVFSGLFGGFLAGIFSALLSAFGCNISG